MNRYLSILPALVVALSLSGLGAPARAAEPSLPPEEPYALAVPHASGSLRFALVSRSGDLLTGPELQAVVPFQPTEDGGLVTVAQGKDGRWGHLDAAGRWVIAPTHEFLRMAAEGLARYRRGDRWGYLDAEGQVAIEPSYLDARPFAQGRAAVRTRKGWHFIDRSGAKKSASYEVVGQYAANGLARARKKDDRWGFLDREGEWAIEPTFRVVLGFGPNGLAPASPRGSELWGFIDAEGTWKIRPIYDDLDPYTEEGYARFAKGGYSSGQTGYLDAQGNELFTFDDTFWGNPICGWVRVSAYRTQYLNVRGETLGGERRRDWGNHFSRHCVTEALENDRFGILSADGTFQAFATADREPLVDGSGGVVGFRGGLGLTAVVAADGGLEYLDAEGRRRFSLRFVDRDGKRRPELLAHRPGQPGRVIWSGADASIVPARPFFRPEESTLLREPRAGLGQLAELVAELLDREPRRFDPPSLIFDGERSPYLDPADGYDAEELADYPLGAMVALVGYVADEVTWGQYDFLNEWSDAAVDSLYERFSKELVATFGAPADLEDDPWEGGFAMGDGGEVTGWRMNDWLVILQSYVAYGDGEFERQIFLGVVRTED